MSEKNLVRGVVIDTSIWIEYFRNKNRTVTEQVEELLVQRKIRNLSLISAELIRGCLHLKEIQIVENTIEKIPHHPIEDPLWRKIGEFCYQLARKGVQTGLIDAAIAYLCIQTENHLYTLDKGFITIAKHSDLKLWVEN